MIFLFNVQLRNKYDDDDAGTGTCVSITRYKTGPFSPARVTTAMVRVAIETEQRPSRKEKRRRSSMNCRRQLAPEPVSVSTDRRPSRPRGSEPVRGVRSARESRECRSRRLRRQTSTDSRPVATFSTFRHEEAVASSFLVV